MAEGLSAKLRDRELLFFCIASTIMMLVGAFCLATPGEMLNGFREIILSRDALITDYFELAGFGAALLNGALVFGLEICLLCYERIPFTGATMAALFINVGFALFGKNMINIWPIIMGTYLYVKVHGADMKQYIYTALFGSCLAPVVTEMVYLLPFPGVISFLIAFGIGILVGFVLPALSAHTASMHRGYNLFNTGFAAGLLAFVLVCILQSVGLKSSPVLIWRAERPIWLIAALYLYFLLTMIYGLWLIWFEEKSEKTLTDNFASAGLACRKPMKMLKILMKRTGQAATDFVLTDGPGITLVNMGLIGILCTTYILLVGGELSGPVTGAILTAFGFAAYGVHIRNYLPVLAGVFLSAFVTHLSPTTPAIQMGAILAIALSPVAGRFGIIPGLLAGALHAVVVVCTASLYGGLNLYNAGFSTGVVAIVLLPVLESFQLSMPPSIPPPAQSRNTVSKPEDKEDIP